MYAYTKSPLADRLHPVTTYSKILRCSLHRDHEVPGLSQAYLTGQLQDTQLWAGGRLPSVAYPQV